MPNFTCCFGKFDVYDCGKLVANFFVVRGLLIVVCFNFFVHGSSYKIVGLLNLAYDFKFSANSAKS